MKGIRFWSKPLISLALGSLAAIPALAQGAQTQPSAPQPPAAAPAKAASFDPSKSDEKAIKIADEIIAAMGGDAWNNAHYLKFTFDVRKGDKHLAVRTHYWDKLGQRVRMEGTSKEGKPVVVVADLKTLEGQATLDGQLLFDADAKKYMQLAQGNLINDTYWLFTPFKIKDPGVRLRYDGELKAGPTTYDKILLTFDDGIGLTSKDRYTLYVNRANHMIERWSYILQGSPANAAPTAWEWTDWKTIGGMKLSTRKTQPGGEVDIVLDDVQILDTLPDSVFTSTAPVGGAAQPAGGQ